MGFVERGYKKQIYHNHGTVNREFIKVGGKAVEGAIAPTGPLIVPEDLPDDNPIKPVALDFTRRYEQTFGEGSRNAFGGYSYDGFLLLNAAVPVALRRQNRARRSSVRPYGTRWKTSTTWSGPTASTT